MSEYNGQKCEYADPEWNTKGHERTRRYAGERVGIDTRKNLMHGSRVIDVNHVPSLMPSHIRLQ